MKDKKLSEKVEPVIQSETPFMQKPTITDAVTRIVDADGNEVKEGAAVKEENKD